MNARLRDDEILFASDDAPPCPLCLGRIAVLTFDVLWNDSKRYVLLCWSCRARNEIAPTIGAFVSDRCKTGVEAFDHLRAYPRADLWVPFRTLAVVPR